MAVKKPAPRTVARKAVEKAGGGKHPGRWVRGNRTQIRLSIAPDLQSKVDAVTRRESLSRAALLTVWFNEKLRQDIA